MNTSFERKAMKEEWLTPRNVIEAFGPFDLDPCASVVRPWPTAKRHYTVKDDGLKLPWEGLVWCNPPYGNKTHLWLRRAAEHGECVCLIFGRTDTDQWHDWIFPFAKSLFFFDGRLKFVNTKGEPSKNTAGAPSVLVAYGKEADNRLYAPKLFHATAIRGEYVPLYSSRRIRL